MQLRERLQLTEQAMVEALAVLGIIQERAKGAVRELARDAAGPMRALIDTSGRQVEPKAGTHTPGPWTNGTTRGIFAGEYMLASAHSMPWMANPDGESAANARLIAAAPDLLDALRQIADLNLGTYTDKSTFEHAQAIARDAIAKAGGAL